MTTIEYLMWIIGIAFAILIAILAPTGYLLCALIMGTLSSISTFTGHKRMGAKTIDLISATIFGFMIGSIAYPVACVALLYKYVLKKPLLVCSETGCTFNTEKKDETKTSNNP